MPASVLTVRQVAERVGACEETVRRWIRDGRLHGVMPGGAKLGYRVYESEVDRLLSVPQGANDDLPA